MREDKEEGRKPTIEADGRMMILVNEKGGGNLRGERIVKHQGGLA